MEADPVMHFQFLILGYRFLNGLLWWFPLLSIPHFRIRRIVMVGVLRGIFQFLILGYRLASLGLAHVGIAFNSSF